MNMLLTLAAAAVLIIFLNWLALYLFERFWTLYRFDTMRTLRMTLLIVTAIGVTLGFVLGGGRP